MSLAFSDTSDTGQDGILQKIERSCGFDKGGITDNADLLAYFTGLVNDAVDLATAMAIKAGGTWQFDDSNHTADYPEIKMALTASQRDYNWVTDEQGNLTLDIYRVFVKESATGFYQEIYTVDTQSDKGVQDLYNEQNVEGVPYRYDKTANGLFLDPIPATTIAGGLKVLINRESSYFLTTDTTKKPGFDGLTHKYFHLQPSYEWARDKSLANRNALKGDVLEAEAMFDQRYGGRARDKKKALKGKVHLFK